MLPLLALTFSLVSTALAGPIHVTRGHNIARDAAPYVTDIEIHESCNATQRRMLEHALSDTIEVATTARDYLNANGADDLVKQYFGPKAEALPSALGVYESLISGNKYGVVLRCDNPDGNCGQPGWRGHWRGENATSETVICDASYTDRLYNSAFCMFGYELATQAPSVYWSIDLIHRMFHIPQIANAAVSHYAEGLAEVLENAEHNSTMSPFDSDALQYFAAHVYALHVGGGEACIGDLNALHHHDEPATTPAPAASSAAPATPASSSEAAAPAPAAPSEEAPATSEADKDCHTHADGTVHCV